MSRLNSNRQAARAGSCSIDAGRSFSRRLTRATTSGRWRLFSARTSSPADRFASGRQLRRRVLIIEKETLVGLLHAEAASSDRLISYMLAPNIRSGGVRRSALQLERKAIGPNAAATGALRPGAPSTTLPKIPQDTSPK